MLNAEKSGHEDLGENMQHPWLQSATKRQQPRHTAQEADFLCQSKI
jgi:hypothetical protein